MIRPSPVRPASRHQPGRSLTRHLQAHAAHHGTVMDTRPEVWRAFFAVLAGSMK